MEGRSYAAGSELPEGTFDLVNLKNENDTLRAEIARLHTLVRQASSLDARCPISPTVSLVSDPAESGLLVSAPTSSSEGETVEDFSTGSPEVALVHGVESDDNDPVTAGVGRTAPPSHVHQDIETSVEQQEIPDPSGLVLRGSAPKEEMGKFAAVATDALQSTQQFVAFHMQRIEPYLARAREVVSSGWRSLTDKFNKLLEKMEPRALQVVLKVKELCAPFEGPFLRLHECSQGVATQVRCTP